MELVIVTSDEAIEEALKREVELSGMKGYAKADRDSVKTSIIAYATLAIALQNQEARQEQVVTTPVGYKRFLRSPTGGMVELKDNETVNLDTGEITEH